MAGTRDKKRARTETEEEAVPGEIEPTTADDDAPVAEPSIVNNKCSDDFDGDNEDDAPLVSNYKMSRAIFNGHECPYLDSISRQVCKTSGFLQRSLNCSRQICLHRLPIHSIICPSLFPFVLCRTLILISRNAAQSLFPTSMSTSA